MVDIAEAFRVGRPTTRRPFRPEVAVIVGLDIFGGKDATGDELLRRVTRKFADLGIEEVHAGFAIAKVLLEARIAKGRADLRLDDR